MDARPAIQRWWNSRKQHPIQVAWGEQPLISEKDGGQLFMAWPLRIKNVSNKVLEDVEIHLNFIERRDIGRGRRVVESPLCLRNTTEKRFDILPGMPRDLSFFRLPLGGGPVNTLEFGRLDGHNSFMNFGPGLYKVGVSLFGRDLDPQQIAIGVGLDPNGSMSFGVWRDDLPWTFSVPPQPSKTPTSDAPELPRPEGK